MKTPVHIVGGFLGSGKTTLLIAELARRGERCAVVVNDFGEAAIDATLLDGAVSVTNIAGGCICCTAPEGLAPSIAAILEQTRPDRIFVEPSGLARPTDVRDMLSRGDLKARISLMPTVVVLDATRAGVPADALDGADVVVLSHADTADEAQLAAARARARGVWPAPLRIVEARQGVVDPAAWEPLPERPPVFVAPHPHGDSTTGHEARSWIFGPEELFSWDRLRAAVMAAKGLVRFKGIFQTDIGWYRLDAVDGRLSPGPTQHRRDSRCDAIVAGGDLDALGAALAEARVDPRTIQGDGIEVVGPDGLGFPLSRALLRSLPGQVPDIGAVVPGRAGSGVRLGEILALSKGSRYVVVAADGMTSTAEEVGGVGDAVLVHSLGAAPLPADQGGPFRLYAPASGSNCRNIKGVVTVRLLD